MTCASQELRERQHLAAIVACNVELHLHHASRQRARESWRPRELRRVTITRGPGSVGQNLEASGGAECSAALTPEWLQRRLASENPRLPGDRDAKGEARLLRTFERREGRGAAARGLDAVLTPAVRRRTAFTKGRPT